MGWLGEVLSDMYALIIDDDRASVDVLSMLLAGESINSTAVLSPGDLADMLDSEQNFAFVFLDLEMPNYDGFEILKQLKTKQRFVGVPIIAYTVHTSEMGAARQAGFDGSRFRLFGSRCR